MKSKALKELDKIKAKHRGLLSPEVVVNTAADPENVLHNWFEWDDEIAGHQHRLKQARQLIRVFVTVLDSDTEPINVYVSLLDDRVAGGGYRSMVDVLGEAGLRRRLLDQATQEFDRWEHKYRQLVELVEVFEAMKRTRKKVKRSA